MEANQMKFNFQLKFDSLFEFSAPAYDDRQISYVLTEAQFRVFIKRYNPLGNKYQKGFEDDEQRRRDLEQLIESASISGLGFSSALTYNCTWTATSNVITIADATGSHGTTVGLYEGQTITSPTGGDGAIGPGGDVDTNVIKTILTDTTFTVVDIPSLASVVDPGGTPVITPILLTSGIGKSSAQGMVHPNGVFLDLPDGFLYAIEEAVVLLHPGEDYVPSTRKEAWVKPVRHDEYLANINNPYKQPYKDLVWRMDIARQTQSEGNEVTGTSATAKRSEIIVPEDTAGGSYSVDHYRMRYLSLPPSITVDEFDDTNQRHCILDETLHREIVDEAVVIAQAAAQKESYQIGAAEKQRSE